MEGEVYIHDNTDIGLGTEQAYQDARQYVAEGVRGGVGSAARTGDEYTEGGVTEGLGNTGRHLSGGDEMGVDGQQMELYIQLWDEIRADFDAGASVDELRGRIDASELERALQEKMVQQLLTLASLPA